MNSITYKLAAIFIALALVPLVIGTAGTIALQTAERALNENNTALQNLSELLSSAGESLTESVALQANAESVTAQISRDQETTYATLRAMGDTMLPRTFAIAQMRLALSDAAAAERALLLALNMRHLNEDELRETREVQMRTINSALQTLASARATYLNLLNNEEEKKIWREFEHALTAWQDNHAEFMKEIANLEALVNDLVRGGPVFASVARKAYDTVFVSGKNAREACENSIALLNQAIARSAESDVKKAMDLQTASQRLTRNLDKETETSAQRAFQLSDQIQAARDTAMAATENSALALSGTARRFWFMVIFSGLGVAGVMMLGLIWAWRISKPVQRMARHMSSLAQGNVSDNVSESERRRKDEIGQFARAMQDMIEASREEIASANAMAAGDYTHSLPLRSENDQLGRAFSSMVRTTNVTLGGVSRAVDRVGEGASSMSNASRSLSEGAQTSAAAVEEISQTVHSVDRQAQENALHATEANQLATGSRDAARRGYAAVTELVGAMNEIQAAGKKIATVAKLIDDIAFQTNLLALNAAVEAARAGRQGKGFSVVADEVRNLSGRSAKAAQETGVMVEAMTARMEAGSLLAERTDHEFREIVEATDKVAKLFENIASASSAQSSAMAQIAQGLNQIDGVIQANTDNATQTTESAQALLRQAEDLRKMVGRFKLLTSLSNGGEPLLGYQQDSSHGSNQSTKRPNNLLPAP